MYYYWNWFQSNNPPISISSSGSGSFGFSAAFGASAGLAAYVGWAAYGAEAELPPPHESILSTSFPSNDLTKVETNYAGTLTPAFWKIKLFWILSL